MASPKAPLHGSAVQEEQIETVDDTAQQAQLDSSQQSGFSCLAATQQVRVPQQMDASDSEQVAVLKERLKLQSARARQLETELAEWQAWHKNAPAAASATSTSKKRKFTSDQGEGSSVDVNKQLPYANGNALLSGKWEIT
eukprot:4128-Heterococcus_DN1.PRE.1